MINSENIHDALTLLPDDLLAPVDALRQKKRIPWKSITAVAACLCLCVGLWFFFPGAAAENAAGSAELMDGNLTGNTFFSESESGSGFKTSEVTVYEVGEDCIRVVPIPLLTDENWCVQIAAIQVTFENLSSPPALQPGQKIRLYYTEYDEDSLTVAPYRIEIIND